MTDRRIRARLAHPAEEATTPLVPDHLSVGLDHWDGERTRPVLEADLDAWGSTVDDLLPAALKRLLRESSPRDWMNVDTVPGMMLHRPPNGDAASRMLVLDQIVPHWPLGGVLVAVPSMGQMLVVTLDSLQDLEALRTLATAADHAHRNAAEPLSDQLFWYDGTAWHLLALTHDDDEVEIDPPEAFVEMLGRLAAMGMVSVAGEA